MYADWFAGGIILICEIKNPSIPVQEEGWI